MQQKKNKLKKTLKIWLSFCMFCTFFSGVGSMQQNSVYAIENELVNVARKDGVKVYTNPSVKNSNAIIDGDTRYQYVTQSARNFIDLSFGENPMVDENGYSYKSDTYVIVDLGASYLIDSLKIFDFEREGKYIRDYIYEVSFSNDSDFDIGMLHNVNWEKIGEKKAGTGKYVTDIEPSTQMMARYIKMDNLKCKGATGFVMVELEAWVKEVVDIEKLKRDSINELTAYKQNIELNSNETEKKTSIVDEYTKKINAASTKEEILEILNAGRIKMDDAFAFAEYRLEKKNEISDYKNEEGQLSPSDKEKQMAELKKALGKITEAMNVEAVDKIVSEYKKVIDSLKVLVTYEIIPSPHDMSYGNKYNMYSKQINVVCSEGTLDSVTKDYINEIFGSGNVTLSTKPNDSKTNLYLTSDDKDDAVENWIRDEYPDKIDNITLSKNESHIIIADENGISIIGNDAEGLFRGLTTIKFLKSQIEANAEGYRDFIIKDYADMSFRGLIEGYYGRPWSWSEKAELLQFGSDFKMNKLVFAPKNDPYHTTKWKELYPDQSDNAENNIQNIEIAASTARKYKSDLVWTAHCFGYTDLANAGENGIRYSEGDENKPGSDINLLKAKFQQLYDVGVRTFGLLLDDCDYGPRTLNKPYENIYNPNEALTDEVLAETTAIVNIMAEWCEEKGDCYDLVFCPAGYVTGWMQSGFKKYFKQAYPYQEISYYDINFKSNVQIMTTGTGVFSDTNQRMADLFKKQAINSQTGYNEGDERRSPLMWTNYPTVDNNSDLDFGPISNFRTDLNPDDLNGMVSNPFQWAQFNKTVIPMVTQYTWNLKDYDANRVYNNSMKYIMDTEELAEAMIIFTNHNNKRGDEGEGTKELKEAIATFKLKPTKVAAEAVLVEIDKIVAACETLLNKDSYDNLGMYNQLYLYANSLKDLVNSIKNYMVIFQQGSNLYNELKESDKLFKRHTSYVLKDIPQNNGTKKDMYTKTGTRTLEPFATWLRNNKDMIIEIANPNAEEEFAKRELLNNYLSEQTNLISTTYYYGIRENIEKDLQKIEEKLDKTLFNDLPTLDELKSQVADLLKAYESLKPVKKEANLVSNNKKVTAGNLENARNNKPSAIIDGNIKTTCSTVTGDPDNPAYVQIDLGESMPLQEIWVVCYIGGRWYKYDVYTSEDGEKFDLIANKDDTIVETEAGNWFYAKGKRARYVRIVGISNSLNQFFHVGEVKVYKKDIDKTNLQSMYNQYLELAEKDYLPSTWKVFFKAMKKAEIILKGEATQNEIDATLEALELARNNLVKKANKEKLKVLVEMAELISEDDLTKIAPLIVTEFKNALKDARAVYTKEEALQVEVEEAYNRLAKGMQLLEIYKDDKEALQKLVDKTNSLAASDYITSSWQALQTVLGDANKVLSNINATQLEINKAYDEVAKAIDNLRLKPNKDILGELINKTNELDKNNYTVATWKVVADELVNAKKVYNDPEAIEAEVNNAKERLTKAISGLVIIPSDSGDINPPLKPNDNDTNTSVKPNTNVEDTTVKTGDNAVVIVPISLIILSVSVYNIIKRRKHINNR